MTKKKKETQKTTCRFNLFLGLAETRFWGSKSSEGEREDKESEDANRRDDGASGSNDVDRRDFFLLDGAIWEAETSSPPWDVIENLRFSDEGAGEADVFAERALQNPDALGFSFGTTTEGSGEAGGEDVRRGEEDLGASLLEPAFSLSSGCTPFTRFPLDFDTVPWIIDVELVVLFLFEICGIDFLSAERVSSGGRCCWDAMSETLREEGDGARAGACKGLDMSLEMIGRGSKCPAMMLVAVRRLCFWDGIRL